MFELRRRAFIALLGATMAGWPLRARSQQGGRVRRMGVLIGLAEGDPEIGKHLSAFRGGLRALGWTDGQNVQIDHRVAGDDIDGVFAAMAEGPPGGVIVMPNVFTAANRDRIVAQAERFRIPTVYPLLHFVAAGGLLSYGVDISDLFRRAASYVDRILKGGKPADLPVQQPTKFELMINLKTAKALGLNVPLTLLAEADNVIE